jgi:uncharacterized protein (TIGR00162 family)
MKTSIVESKIRPSEPVIIEGLPGLGSVGRIVAQEVIRSLKAKRIATLYSPQFPYYAIVDRKGLVRLPTNEFYHWRNRTDRKEMLVITGDCQPQTSVGQYEIADIIMNYAAEHSAKLIVTVGGYSSEKKDEAKVIGAATKIEIVKKLSELGVVVNRSGIPVVGVSGLILGLAQPRELPAICLLGETVGYVPDPKAAKNVLKILTRLLGIDVNFEGIDRDIIRMNEIESKVRQAEEKMDLDLKGSISEKTTSYIS